MQKIIGAPTLDDALSALAEEAEAHEKNRERTLVFCEDKLTLLAERAILSKVGGTFLSEVTTFARYISGPGVISKQGSVMLISELIEERKGKLFREGSAQAVYETLAQLSASQVDEELLEIGAGECEGTLREKLSELRYFLSAYRRQLERLGLLDENGYLALLPERIARGGLERTNVLFFGFPSFTKQAQAGVAAALRCAKSVTGIFLSGREELYTNEGARAFLTLCKAQGEVRAEMRKTTLRSEALHLNRNIFSYARGRAPMETKNVQSFTAPNEEEEYRCIAALIRKEVSLGKRWRDVAVLVPDMESLPALEKAFTAYKIPFFADKKRKFCEHPFCRFALSVLSAAWDGVLPEEADEILSSVYFGDDGQYRNYLMKYGRYRGAYRRPIKEESEIRGFDRAALISSREKLCAILALFPAKGSGKQYAEGVRALFSLVSGEEVTARLKEYFTGAEERFLDPSPLEGVLREIEALSGTRNFTVRAFQKTLKNGLEALEIAMIPQSLDAVFVGDATDSSFARVKALFVSGLSGALPRTSQDTALITDREIGRLKSLRVEIEPAIAQVNARARESLALNLCAFEETLTLSCSLTRGGKECAPGIVLKDVGRLFRLPNGERPEGKYPALFPYDCCEEGPALLKLLALKSAVEAGRDERREFSTLYHVLEARKGEAFLEKLLSEGDKEEIRSREAPMSPTALERYFECPYSGFLQRELRLREREERPVQDTDAGTFVHAVLEECAKSFNDLKGEDECRALAREIGEKLLALPRYSALTDTPEGRYASFRLVKEGEEVAAACYFQLAHSKFRVWATEGKIALRELALEGKTDRIDRSDEYVRVIDYKTGKIDDKASSYYTGRKLQLQLYLKAAAAGKRPAGAFYFPAQDGFCAEGDVRFRMSGFFSGEDDVLTRMDAGLKEGEKSLFFEGKRDGKYTDKGMKQADFEAFLDYGLMIGAKAEHEMRQGNIRPLPYEGACAYCKFGALCGFTGKPRKETNVTCASIVEIVRRERGEI